MEDKKIESLDTTLNGCESSNKKIIDFIRDWWIIVVIVFFAILVIIKVKDFYFKQQDLCLISQEIESLGQMGDFFGGILNPILGFLSFCLLLITIKYQSKELKHSTEELAKSSQALTEQSISLKIQNFENTFFKMLDLHNNISYKLDGKINFSSGLHKYKKDGILTPIIIRFEYNNSFYDISEKILNQEDKELILDYIFSALNPCLGHYFRNIYQILKFIDSSDFIKNKKFYSNILRAQLNQDEQRILFFNCISENGINMLSLVTKYEFLEHLNYHTEFKDNFLKLYIQESKKLDANNNHKAFGNNVDFIKACNTNDTQ